MSTIFSRMTVFFERPGGLFGEAAFVPEPVIRTTETTAWTQPGGLFLAGATAFIPVKNDANLVPIRLDTIYFTTGFIMQTVPQRAYTIVVSHAPAIRDRVYAHRDFDAFTKLSAAERIANTDHYTMLAFEQGTGQQQPPAGL